MALERILVTGATGQQGGAVLDHLLDDEAGPDVEVQALTRHSESEHARELARRGAEVVEGDLLERNSLRPLVEEADGVFLVTDFWELGYEDEIEAGTNMAEVCAEEGVDHLVFNSVGGAERDTGISHFDSKWEIERRIEELDLPATVLRPVFFMSNFESMHEEILDGTLALPLQEGVSLQLVDVDDLGALVARAFARSEDYIGESYEVAGDEHTLVGMAAAFADVTTVDVEGVTIELDDVRREMGAEYADMWAWFNEDGYEANIDQLEADHDIEFTTLVEYLRAHGWERE